MLLANGAKAISGKGKHQLTYVLPLTYFNNTDLLVVAALDEVDDRKRIAHTSDADSCRFAIRNKDSGDTSLLRKDNTIHGHWVDHEEFMYKHKDI